jgi:DNA polymerase-3 subunit alpha
MKLLIFDTETTGLPKQRFEDANKKPNNWPHIVSISWVVLESETNKIVSQRSYIIKPQWVIPNESIAIHKITNEIAHRDGVPLRNAIVEFLAEPYDKMIAHNIEFDINVIENAVVWDLKMGEKWLPKSLDCTMIISQRYCKLPGKFGSIHKLPKLKELYEFIFKRQPAEDKLHGSLYDTLILVECIQNCEWLRNELGLTKPNIYRPNGLSNTTLSINFT